MKCIYCGCTIIDFKCSSCGRPHVPVDNINIKNFIIKNRNLISGKSTPRIQTGQNKNISFNQINTSNTNLPQIYSSNRQYDATPTKYQIKNSQLVNQNINSLPQIQNLSQVQNLKSRNITPTIPRTTLNVNNSSLFNPSSNISDLYKELKIISKEIELASLDKKVLFESYINQKYIQLLKSFLKINQNIRKNNLEDLIESRDDVRIFGLELEFAGFTTNENSKIKSHNIIAIENNIQEKSTKWLIETDAQNELELVTPKLYFVNDLKTPLFKTLESIYFLAKTFMKDLRKNSCHSIEHFIEMYLTRELGITFNTNFDSLNEYKNRLMDSSNKFKGNSRERYIGSSKVEYSTSSKGIHINYSMYLKDALSINNSWGKAIKLFPKYYDAYLEVFNKYLDNLPENTRDFLLCKLLEIKCEASFLLQNYYYSKGNNLTPLFQKYTQLMNRNGKNISTSTIKDFGNAIFLKIGLEAIFTEMTLSQMVKFNIFLNEQLIYLIGLDANLTLENCENNKLIQKIVSNLCDYTSKLIDDGRNTKYKSITGNLYDEIISSSCSQYNKIVADKIEFGKQTDLDLAKHIPTCCRPDTCLPMNEKNNKIVVEFRNPKENIEHLKIFKNLLS